MADNDQDHVFSRLSAKQRRAVETLAGGGSKAEAAAAAGVSERTIDRYVADPNVRAALDKGVGTAVGDVARRMVAGMDKAVTTMVDILEDDKASLGVKLRAAIAIIEHGPRLLDAHDLAQRVARLEELLREYQNENAG